MAALLALVYLVVFCFIYWINDFEPLALVQTAIYAALATLLLPFLIVIGLATWLND